MINIGSADVVVGAGGSGGVCNDDVVAVIDESDACIRHIENAYDINVSIDVDDSNDFD